MVKRILLALGGTPLSPAAIELAMDVARAHGAAVTALPLVDRTLWMGRLGSLPSASGAARLASQRPWEEVRRRVAEMRDGFRVACDRAGVGGTFEDTEERPFQALAREWRHHDLLVFGLRGLFDHSLVPHPEEVIAELIGGGGRPILAAAAPYRPVRRVLLAYTGSSASANAMKDFVRLGLWPEAELRLVRFGGKGAAEPGLFEKASVYLLAHGRKHSTERVDRPAEDALLDYTRDPGADLIVLGDSHRRALLSNSLGDTMSRAVRESPVPLFLSH